MEIAAADMELVTTPLPFDPASEVNLTTSTLDPSFVPQVDSDLGTCVPFCNAWFSFF